MAILVTTLSVTSFPLNGTMKRSNRTIQSRVMLSPEEQKAFNALAEKRGTHFSELVRQLLHRELKAEKTGQAA
jgi:hypothetical protein